jgi:phosphatidylinositol alpha 1,6-mannosyltransferase
MASHRLIEGLNQFDPIASEVVFGDEARLAPPDPSIKLAPVKRVAIIAEAFLPKVDGVSKTAYLAMRYLQQTGREVIVIAPDYAPSQVSGVNVYAMPSFGVWMAPETRVGLPHPYVQQRLEEFKPDLVHMFSPFILSLTGMFYARQAGIPVIANYQTDLPGYAGAYGWHFLSHITRDWLRFIHNNCHSTLAPSNWTMQQLHEWGYHRVRRWGRGVNSRRFNPKRRNAFMRERLLNGRDPKSLLVVYVGRLAPEKHVELLSDVARLPGIALTVIGDGPLREELESQFEGTGTYFPGYMFGDDLADAYASADAFVFTGTQETFGQVVQEALASGLPSVIVNQGGITDLVTDGVTGFVCPHDPAAFARAIARLRDEDALRQEMAYNARHTVEDNSWEATLAQLEGHYSDAVALNDRLLRIHPESQGILPVLLNRGR